MSTTTADICQTCKLPTIGCSDTVTIEDKVHHECCMHVCQICSLPLNECPDSISINEIFYHECCINSQICSVTINKNKMIFAQTTDQIMFLLFNCLNWFVFGWFWQKRTVNISIVFGVAGLVLCVAYFGGLLRRNTLELVEISTPFDKMIRNIRTQFGTRIGIKNQKMCVKMYKKGACQNTIIIERMDKDQQQSNIVRTHTDDGFSYYSNE